MSRPVHTPGPWNWHIHDHSMATLHGADLLRDTVMCVSPCQSCQKGKRRWKWDRCTTPSLANARLIAAAPDLLAALTLLHDNLAEYQRINNLGGYDNHDMRMARAAIEKARGENV